MQTNKINEKKRTLYTYRYNDAAEKAFGLVCARLKAIAQVLSHAGDLASRTKAYIHIYTYTQGKNGRIAYAVGQATGSSSRGN